MFLATLVADGNDSIDLSFALSLFAQVARGVKHVHSQSLIHRDLKPSNCFIDNLGTVKIGDFGLSREAGEHINQSSQSQSGETRRRSKNRNKR